MLKNYELCAIFSGDNTTEEIDATAKEIEKLLALANAQIVFAHNYGRKKIAYPIKGANNGEYRLWYFQAEGREAYTFKDKLKLSGLALRFLLLGLGPKDFAIMLEKTKELASGRVRKPLPPRETEAGETKEAPSAGEE